MKLPVLLSVLLLGLAPAALRAADTKPAEKSGEAPKRHPLRGVITAVLPEKSAFMVKHEEIPGVMRAMTMLFQVDAAALKTFKTGDAVTGLMSRQPSGWVLDDVKAAPAAKK